jgi:hypothetical protein
MDCITRWSVVTVLSFGLFAGCSKTTAPDGATATNTASEVPAFKETDPATNPMAKAAYDFLDAVLKGDTQRASARLTPEAMQRIVQSGKQFSPPGLETATFKIGEVRSPSEDQAIVQCVLTDASQGAPHSEEMCCLLRKVENDWRVCGIAYGTTPDKPWTLTNFESGQNMAIPRQTMGSMAGNQGNGQQPIGGSQANAGASPVTPSGPAGMPPVAAPYGNPNTTGTAGLGMPAVAPQGQTPYGLQPQQPYTAQEPQGAERR